MGQGSSKDSSESGAKKTGPLERMMAGSAGQSLLTKGGAPAASTGGVSTIFGATGAKSKSDAGATADARYHQAPDDKPSTSAAKNSGSYGSCQ